MTHYEAVVQRREVLGEVLDELIEQTHRLEIARNKGRSGRRERQVAERAIRDLATQLVQDDLSLDPHVAYAYASALNLEGANEIRDAWRQQHHKQKDALIPGLEHLPELSGNAILPSNSFVLQVRFTLAKPYLSRDDAAFHLIDNPVRRDWVFRVPMIASTSWKGALRATFWQHGHDEKSDLVERLFGTAREGEAGQQGRLRFYPTFFQSSDASIELINPHDRETGVAAIGPIPFEAVRASAEGELRLLYVPFGDTPKQIANDLYALVPVVYDLLTVYGVGAKTSSAYGTAVDKIDGQLLLNASIGDHEPPVLLAFDSASELEEIADHLVALLGKD